MSDDKKKRGKPGKPQNNIVQFPQQGGDGPDLFEDLYEEMVPEFFDYYLPVAVEFASITAVEIMKYAEEARKQMEKGPVANESLEIVFVKLRGLSIIIPSVDILGFMDEMLDDSMDADDYPDIIYLHDIIDDAVAEFEDLMDACGKYFADHGGKVTPIPGKYLLDHDGGYVLDEVRDTAEEVLMELSTFAAQLFSWNNEE